MLWAPVIMGVALVAGLAVLGGQIAGSRSQDTITVTGSVKRQVTADLAKWKFSFSRTTGRDTLKDGITRLENDTKTIRAFIVAHGIAEAGIRFEPVRTYPIYEQLPNYGQSSTIIGHNLFQSVVVESTDVEKMTALSQEAIGLADRGFTFGDTTTEYYYTGLAALRPQLFADATKDAKVRAEGIAAGTGVKIGAPRSARTGVIQILPPNSTDVADYGAYDLSTKEKEITATVSVSFGLK